MINVRKKAWYFLYHCAKYSLMFVYEATSLLKDVICPHCKKDTRVDMAYPFKKFNALELNNSCKDKECMSFFEQMATRFSDYETGHINEAELQDWLNAFRNSLGIDPSTLL